MLDLRKKSFVKKELNCELYWMKKYASDSWEEQLYVGNENIMS